MAVGDNRKLLRAEAIGLSHTREGAPNAWIETRRYAPPTEAGGEQVLEQVFFIDGPRILANDAEGTVSMPAAGRAIIRDQRAAATQAQLSNSTGVPLTGAGSGGSRGTSMFTWGESMLFTRATGVLTMKKDTKLVHLPLGSTQATTLTAQQMDATFDVQKGTPGKDRSAELVKATATGSVYAESGQQHLVCDTFEYNALGGTAEASAGPQSRVTFSDDRKGTQLVARKLFWDLVKDRVEILEAAPVTTQR
jgi:hypothetical protein